MTRRRRTAAQWIRATAVELVLLLVFVWVMLAVVMPMVMDSASHTKLQLGPTAVPSATQ